jgi:serine/threonine protein phosphatase 1
MKTYVIGDIHGGYRALVQVLERSGFDYENDKLISLGDVCDGWSQTAECFEHLFTIKNLIYIKGNHDEWTQRFLKSIPQNNAWGGGVGNPRMWLTQGYIVILTIKT